MKLKYIGEHKRIGHYGIEFNQGKLSDVPDDLMTSLGKKGSLVADKLKNHPDFEIYVLEEVPKAKKKAKKKVKK